MWQISYPPANGASLGSYLRQTDRQIFDTVYRWVGVFFSSQNFLPPYSLRSQGDNFNSGLKNAKVHNIPKESKCWKLAKPSGPLVSFESQGFAVQIRQLGYLIFIQIIFKSRNNAYKNSEKHKNGEKRYKISATTD